MFACQVPLSQCCVCGVQGYCLAGKTPLQVARSVESGRNIDYSVSGHVIAICHDPDMMHEACYEMWPADPTMDAVTNEFKWLKDNYSPPSDLTHLFDRKEIIIQFKTAVSKMTRNDVLNFVGPNKFRGGALWIPFSQGNLYRKLLYDIKSSASPPYRRHLDRCELFCNASTRIIDHGLLHP